MPPCSDAMIRDKDVLTLSPDATVEEALKIFEDNDIRTIPVIDKDGKIAGLFGLKELLFALLPASVRMENGLENLEFLMGADAGIAKRLKKLHAVPVNEIMNKKPVTAHEDTATIEALRLMALEGSPVLIADEKNGKFLGMISRKSLIQDLYKVLEQIEKESTGEEGA